MPRTPVSASQETCARWASASTVKEPSSLNGVTFATYTPSIVCISASSSLGDILRRLSFQSFSAFYECPQLLPVRQAFVVPQSQHVQGTHGVSDAETFLRREIPQPTGEIPSVEGIAGPDGIHLRYLEARLRQDAILGEGHAPFLPELEHHLLRARRRQLPNEFFVVPLPKRSGLLIAEKEQVHMGQQLFHEIPRLFRRPELGAVVDVEAQLRPARAALSRRPQGEGAALLREGGGDTGKVQKARLLKASRI